MATPIYYFDISKIGKDFTGKKDIALLTNEQAVLESIKNIILTEPGERVMYPTFGCGISKYLFEQLDVVSMFSMQSTITNSIRRFEARIDKLEVTVIESINNNSVEVNVYFTIKTSNNTQTLNLILNKIR